MKDIAKDLGVSIITVSKAIRGLSDISQTTKKRVLKRVKELNYQPNMLARSLATRKSFTVGLVIPEMMHSYYAEVAKGLSTAILPSGYRLLISHFEADAELEQQEIQALLARQIDGLVISSFQKEGQTEIFDQITRSGVPYVLIDRGIPGLEAHYVGWDQPAYATLAIEHLMECGCTRIAYIRYPPIDSGPARGDGYWPTLKRHGIKVPSTYMISASYGDGTGYDAMRKLLTLDPRPDGVACHNDPVAAQAIRAILDAGLRIPDDIAVIGVGNILYSDLLRVPLTTIDQRALLTGQRAGELLLRVMSSRRRLLPREVSIPPKLIVRESTMRKKALENLNQAG
jgi:LacI family transcriptional regulator